MASNENPTNGNGISALHRKAAMALPLFFLALLNHLRTLAEFRDTN
jgi:hypothetical protein